MGRNKTVLGLPQRVAGRQRLRVRHVQGGPANLAVLEGLDQGLLVDDGSTRDIDKKGLFGAEDRKLFFTDEPLRGLGEGQAEDQQVEPLREELVERVLGRPVVPARGQCPLGITHPGGDERAVTARLWGEARGGCVGDDFHAYGIADTGDLSSYGAISDNASIRNVSLPVISLEKGPCNRLCNLHSKAD